MLQEPRELFEQLAGLSPVQASPLGLKRWGCYLRVRLRSVFQES
jgi:hypothetical protein